MGETAVEINPCKADLERRQRAFRERALVERVGNMERRIEFIVGYDHRGHPEACGGGGHGQHGMELAFILVGPGGATQWKINMPGWTPGSVDPLGNLPVRYPQLDAIYAVDLGYHSPVPQYEGQEEYGRMECDLLPGRTCFYDGSGLNAGPVLEQFLSHGPAAVWAELARYYQSLFGAGGDVPVTEDGGHG